jgi:hypothetical protein
MLTLETTREESKGISVLRSYMQATISLSFSYFLL